MRRGQRRPADVRAPAAVALAAAALTLGTPAFGQWSGSAAAVSDYRYRGISLSDNDPAMQGSVAYDHPNGAYAGLFGSTVRFNYQPTSLQGMAYGGYSHRFANGWSGEAGGDYSTFSQDHNYDYGEVYVGAAIDNVSGRLYYANNYFGQHTAALYAELNATTRVLERIDLFAHAGALRPRDAAYYGAPPARFQYDARLGAGIDVAGLALALAWVGTNTASTVYPSSRNARRNTIVLTVTHPF